MTGRHLPRTYLFVPGDRPERFAKALASGADAVVIDLEDAVLPAAKAAARAAVAAYFSQTLAALDAAERSRVVAQVVIRINDEASEWFTEDLALLAACGATAAMLPKAERVASVERLRAACPLIDVLALVETARGVIAAEALAAAPGVQRLVFGTIDLALDLDLQGDLATTLGLDHAASRLAIASRAAGIAAPVAGVTTAIHDEALLLAELARARAHGFGAKLCIHPLQVAPIHRALQPTATELSWAQRVLEATQVADATHTPTGAVQIDGRMIDKPVIERARRIVERSP